MTQKTSLNERIEQILTDEQSKIDQHSLKGKLKRIWQEKHRKPVIKAVLMTIWNDLSKKAIFTLFLIISFIFMLIVIVL